MKGRRGDGQGTLRNAISVIAFDRRRTAVKVRASFRVLAKVNPDPFPEHFRQNAERGTEIPTRAPVG